MNINVPEHAREHFWDEPPPGSTEFWAFPFKPRCQVGDPLYFRFDSVAVAMATVCDVEPPGLSKCASTGKYRNRWKVFWDPESFLDLRGRW